LRNSLHGFPQPSKRSSEFCQIPWQMHAAPIESHWKRQRCIRRREEVGLERDVGVKNGGGVDGGVDDGVVLGEVDVDSASSSVDLSTNAGLSRSIKTVTCPPETSTREYFSARISTGKGPSYGALSACRNASRRQNTLAHYPRSAGMYVGRVTSIGRTGQSWSM